MSKGDFASGPARKEGVLGSYLKSVFIGGFALGVIGFLVDWWLSLPPPEVPWFGPKLRFSYVFMIMGILGGLLSNYTKRRKTGGY